MNFHYLDHNATTPLHPEVAEAMTEAARVGYGNPSSLHSAGREARRRVEDARETLARALGADPSSIVFTSGGSEANNLAILGAAASGRLRGRHVVVAAFEHPSVLEAFGKLEQEGWTVDRVGSDGNGVMEADAMAAALREDTALVSVMAANNEVGTVQPTAAIGDLLRSRGILYHCDAVQALGKLALKPGDWADYAAFAAHKINGPKGVGALFVRKGAPLRGLVVGGPQERRLRGGTENVPGIVGFAKAVELWEDMREAETARLAALRDSLEAALRGLLPGLIVNGSSAPRLPGTLNVTLPGCRADLMVLALDMRGVAVSAGSACASGAAKHSHVLMAMGKGKDAAANSLRFSLGSGNSEAEIAWVAGQVAEVAESVRAS